MNLTRRNFLRSAGAATLLLSLDRLTFGQAATPGMTPAGAPAIPDYRAWEDVLRKEAGVGQGRPQLTLRELLVPGTLRLERLT